MNINYYFNNDNITFNVVTNVAYWDDVIIIIIKNVLIFINFLIIKIHHDIQKTFKVK